MPLPPFLMLMPFITFIGKLCITKNKSLSTTHTHGERSLFLFFEEKSIKELRTYLEATMIAEFILTP